MPLVLEKVPTAHLLIAGHDPWEYGKDLQSLISQLGLEKRVQLTGFQSNVKRFLNTLDVFAFASVSEGFGQVLIEAMAAAKPIVATNIPPINEIVEHDRSGFLVSPTKEAFADAITTLLLQPDRSLLMGKHGRDILSDRFSANRMAEETVTVYKQALQRSGCQKLR
jgi:glycosyltransferase involved in cell wall biosynthesis